MTRRSLLSPRVLSPAVAISLSALTLLQAATYIVPDDADLVRKTEVIVRGRVIDLLPVRNAEGGIETEITVAVTRALKGANVPSVVVLRQPGGEMDGRIDVYPGIGSFARDEEVLLFLDRRPGGLHRLTDFALGKFHVGRASDGTEILRRDGLAGAGILSGGRVTEAIPPGAPGSEPDRDAASFETFIGEVLRDGKARSDYLLPEAQPGAHLEFTFLPASDPARWIEFDSDIAVTYHDSATGDLGSLCSNGCHAQVQAGVEDWNGTTNTKILLNYGGTDASIGTKGLSGLDNQIQFNDPQNEITNLNACTGTLALGGYSGQSSGGGSVTCPATGGSSLGRITSAQILINNGVGSCLGACNYEDMIAHETGHTIGAGHSNVSTALMAANLVSARCGAPQPDDVAFAQCLYLDGGCLPPVVTSATAKRADGMWKAVVIGSGFKKGSIVQIDAGTGFVSAPRTARKSKTKVIGKDVESIWPAGPTVQVRVISEGCPSDPISVSR